MVERFLYEIIFSGANESKPTAEDRKKGTQGESSLQTTTPFLYLHNFSLFIAYQFYTQM